MFAIIFKNVYFKNYLFRNFNRNGTDLRGSAISSVSGQSMDFPKPPRAHAELQQFRERKGRGKGGGQRGGIARRSATATTLGAGYVFIPKSI